jgi:hypothetical protein
LSVASGDYDFVMATTSDLVGDIDPQQPDFVSCVVHDWFENCS